MPSQLVRRAIERSRDDEIDECWCLFDVEAPESHPDLHDAIALARDNGIKLAISNPCFELWLILHLDDHGAWITTANAERKSRQLDGRTGKRIDAGKYMPKRAEAALRAERLAQRHAGNANHCPDDNPSSGMAAFLAAVEPGG